MQMETALLTVLTLFVLSATQQTSLALKIAGLGNHHQTPSKPYQGLVGNDQLENPINNIGYGGRIRPLSNGNAEGSGSSEYAALPTHPNTGLEVSMCPRFEDKISTGSEDACPRGWQNGPSCDQPDLRTLGRCKWEEGVRMRSPARLEEFKGVSCLGRRMRCLSDAGVIPGNTEMIYAPKNFMSDKAELAEALSYLDKLAAIDLSRNGFYFLSPKSFLNNRVLRSVKFDQNFLLDIPEMIFFGNRYLTSASFAGNRLDYLPPRLFALNPWLSVVDFTGNNISLIPPDVFRRNRRLQIVRLKGNALPKIPAGLFAANPFLREVDLAHNRITGLPENLFRNNRNLREVSLAGNKIKHIPANMFDNCRELRTVKLERNRITTLPAKLFELNKKLSLIDISYNRFHEVDPEIFTGNPVVYVVNRPWDRQHTVTFEENEQKDDDSPYGSRVPDFVRKSSQIGN